MIAGLYARGHGRAMGNSWADARITNSHPKEKALVSRPISGADDGIRTRDPHLGKISWPSSHASPSVSPVPLSCAFLSLLSHASHQIAGGDSISLVISLVGSGHDRYVCWRGHHRVCD